MNASELIAERAEHLARVKQINEALELLGNPGAAVEIDTRRNLRNTSVGYHTDPNDWETHIEVKVYSDETLTSEASEHDHGGWITAQDAASLKAAGEIDGIVWRFARAPAPEPIGA